MAFIYSYSSLIYSRSTYETSKRKKVDPQKTHEKKFGPTKYPRGKKGTDEISTRKNYGPTKARYHDSTRLARPMMAPVPRNLAQSV